MNGRFLIPILYVLGLLSIIYGFYGLVRLIQAFSIYAAEGLDLVEIVAYSIDFIFAIILAIGSGLTQLLVGWLLSRTLSAASPPAEVG